MKATLTLLVCMLWSGCITPAVRADLSTEDPTAQARELLKLSETQNVENHGLAIQTALQALELFRSANDFAGMAATHSQIGQYYFARNDLTEATQYYDLALQLWRQQSNPREQALALINLGYIEGRKGEWLSGVSYLTQAHTLINEQDDPSLIARIASGMAYVFNESGLPESGLTQYQRAQEYFRRAQDSRHYNRMAMLIGYTHFLLEDYSSARTQLEEALTYLESSTYPAAKLDAAQCHEYMGQLYIATGEYTFALRHLEPLLAIYRSPGNRREEAVVEAMIGQIYEQQGSLARARARYLRASRILRGVEDKVSDAAVRFALGRLELNSGNYQLAENYLKESIENTENIRRDLSTRVFAAAFSASVHERYEAYIECLMRKHKLQPTKGFETAAFEASELARARSLAELLRDTQTSLTTGVDPQLAQKEKALRQAIRANVDQTLALLATDYQKEDLDKVEASLTRLREEHKQITARLRANHQNDPIKEPPGHSLDQIQKLIIEDDQTVLLEYLLGPNASYVWAISHNSVRVFELPRAAVITEAVRSVYENLSSEPGSETESRLKKATAELSQMVLGPVAAQLTASRVIVVADGALNYIPFQLLPNPSGSNEPMVAKHEVVNAPSASILGQLRQEKQYRHPTRILAAFGDPVFASNYAQFKSANSGALLAEETNAAEPWRRAWRDLELNSDSLDPANIQPLNFTKFELKNLSDIAGSGSLVARGFDASRQTLEGTDFSQYAILHFATHGLLVPSRPEHSGFFLSMVDSAGRSQDGFIKMQDVFDLQAPVDLVVLSACRTGLGKDVRGEGLIGLTRAFMHAGASAVVASLWKVDDEATAELMKHFYANMLQKGMRPAEALRAAQNTLRQTPPWQSPHYWAAFTLQGEFKQSIRVPESKAASFAIQKTVGGALLLALLAGISWGYWRRRRGPASK